MRISYLFVALLVPALSLAQDGRIYYGSGEDHGTNIEFPNFNMRINAQIQTGLNYTDYDEADARGLEDTTDFDLARARLAIQGEAFDGRIGYRLENDFADDTENDEGKDDSELKDAFLQYNLSDFAKVRWGQFRTAVGRQRNVPSTHFQFVDRSIVSLALTNDRNRGGMLHGGDDVWGYKVGIFNGESTGEGINRAGVDNNVLGSFGLHYNFGEFGSRDVEGDHREGDRPLAATLGSALNFGQGELEGVDTDVTNLSVDLGVRCGGTSFQTEFIYSETDIDAAASSIDDTGLYAQLGHMFGDYEGGLRFGFIDPDNSFLGQVVDKVYEYSFVVSKFLDGHNLKIQNQITWTVTDLKVSGDGGNDDFSDFRYDLLVSAYL